MLKFIQGFSNHFDTNFLRLIKGHLQKILVIHDESDLVEVKKYQNSTFIFVCQYISSRGSEATVRYCIVVSVDYIPGCFPALPWQMVGGCSGYRYVSHEH